MAPAIMQLFTDSVGKHGALTGKVGAAFSVPLTLAAETKPLF